MRIQSKLFLLLVVIAVLPLIALTWRSQRATESLGQAIVSEGRSSAVEDIEQQLGRVVDYSSDALSAQQKLVELALRVQAVEVERRLGAAVPTDAQVYMAGDFAVPATWPPGTTMSLERSAVVGGGKVAALPISTKHQSFFVPREATVDPAEMARLASMDGVYAELNAANPQLFFWQYTALASGLHTTFPGHGSYPENYDPRQRPWYRLAAAAGEQVWTPPMWDAATGRLLLTASMPVRDPQGAIAGVTAIDVEILSVLNAAHEKIKLGANAASLIVRLAAPDGGLYVPGPDAPRPSLRVVAASTAQQQGAAAWDADVNEPLLAVDAPGGARTIVDDLLAGRGGFREMPYKGARSIWVYRKLNRLNAGLVYIVPVGDVEAVADLSQESVRVATGEQVRLASIASLGLIALVALAAMLVSRSITEPLRSLAATARELAAGNLDARAPVSSGDEVGELARVFNAMVPELRTHIKTKEALSVAREVQQKLLPAAAPEIAGFEAAAMSVYSEEVGGDYYDFLCLVDDEGERRLGVLLGDVTGHGIPAALTMTAVRALVRSHAGDGRSLSPVMRAINRHLAADSTRGHFVTLVYMVIEPASRTVRWSSAGHGPILFYNADTYGFEELDVHDIPLGVQPEWSFQEMARSDWPSAGVLVIGTDGVWETKNAEGRMFGKDNLVGVVRASAHLPAPEICRAIIERLGEFRGSAPQNDDLSLVVVKFLPSDSKAS